MIDELGGERRHLILRSAHLHAHENAALLRLAGGYRNVTAPPRQYWMRPPTIEAMTADLATSWSATTDRKTIWVSGHDVPFSL